MSEPQNEQPQSNDGGDAGAERDLSKANPLNKAIHGSEPGVPRQIRARTGQTEDPVPEGKHVAEHKVRLPIVAQEKTAAAAQAAQIAQIEAGAHPDSSKEAKKAKKEEMERLHGDPKSKYTKWETSQSPQNAHMQATKQMDSRRAHYGQNQTNRSQS